MVHSKELRFNEGSVSLLTELADGGVDVNLSPELQ